MSTLHDELATIFGDDGWLVREGGRYLPEQRDYALAMADWLTGASDRPLGLIEGETGTGKTLGYLFPVLLNWVRTGQRAIIATHTISLQNQLIQGDLQLVEKYLLDHGHPLPVTQQRLGMRHFVDPDRVARLASEEPGAKDRSDLLAWALSSSREGTGIIEEWTELYGPLPEGISRSMICLTPDSPAGTNPIFDAEKKQAREAHIVFTSHMMVLIEALNRRPILDIEHEQLHHIVFDEADQVASSAEPLSNRRVQPREVSRQLEKLVGQGSSQLDRKLIESIKAIKGISHALQSLGNDHEASEIVLDDNAPTPARADYHLSALQAECQGISESIRRSALRKNQDQGPVGEALSLLDWVTRFREDPTAAEYGVHALAWSPVLNIPSLMYQKANPSFFVSNLWRKMGVRVCFTSATLGASRSATDDDMFTPLKARLAMGRDKVCIQRQFSPKHFGRAEFVLADPTVTHPIEFDEAGGTHIHRRWLEYLARMTNAASETGPTLVLTVSYQEAARLGKHLKGLQPIVHHHGTSLNEAIEAFRRGNSQVLITPAAWQGISIRDPDGGQLMKNLVVTRIPFLPPDKTAERLAMVMSERYSQITPNQARMYESLKRRDRALIKLRQGFGRIIRQQSDEAVIWIADPRFPRPGERHKNTAFVGAIPQRFLAAYERARILPLDGPITGARKEVASIVQEFMSL